MGETATFVQVGINKYKKGSEKNDFAASVRGERAYLTSLWMHYWQCALYSGWISLSQPLKHPLNPACWPDNTVVTVNLGTSAINLGQGQKANSIHF